MNEDIHLLTYHGRMSVADVLELTWDERQWHLERLTQQVKEETRMMHSAMKKRGL